MKKYALLGEKLSHSFSPQIHKLLGDYEYELLETSRENLKNAVFNPNYAGFNVTIPYKKEAIKYLDEISEEAQKIGSVNTVVKKNGKIYGFNTDYYGFKYMLETASINPKGLKVLILGNGGVCPTVKTALEDMGAKEILIISRKGENNYDNISIHSDTDMIVNTTPVGMFPNNGESPVNLDNFPKIKYIADLIYNPLKTRLVLEGEKRGIKSVGGISMLVSQAKKASELFTECEIPDIKQKNIIEKIVKNKKNIVLIGMPGCGKSTLGNLLAMKIGYDFYDTDKIIENEYNINISDFIKEKGEESFRKLESEVIGKIGKTNHAVISVGGGAVTVEENCFNLKQNSAVIWVKRDLNELTDKDRPISQKYGVEKLYEMRKPIYQAVSDFEIENVDITSSLKKLEDIINNENFSY